MKNLNITQERMLSAHSTDTEIFDKLNIDIKSALNSSKKDSYMMGYINTLSFLNSDLKSILTDTTLNLKEKQERLEKLSQQNQAFNLELQYNVPKVLSKLITKLDSILLDSDNLKNDDVSSYLPSVLAEKLGDHSNLRKSYKTKDLVQTIILFKDILKVFKYMDNSFGLFLVYNLVSLVRADFNDIYLRKKVKESEYTQRKVFFSNVNPNEFLKVDGEILLNLKRVDVTETFGQKLIESFNSLKNACLYDIKKINIENSNLEKLELFKMLSEKYDKNMLESIQILKLGVYCISILEALNILVDDGLTLGKKKTSSKIKIDKIHADEILSIPLRPKNLPMIVRPNFWKKDKTTEEGNLNYGGYLFNKVFNYPAILNRHKKGVTVITEEDLKTFNFLQSNFYNINDQFFEYVESNFKDVVLKYLRKVPNVEFLISNFNDKSTNSIKIQSISELFFKDQELSCLFDKLQTQGKLKILLDQISKRQEFLIQSYQDVATIFFGLIHAYILARYYKSYEFYFIVFMDSRGRIYYKSSGAAFGLQTGDFSKALIDLAGNSYNSQYDIPNKAQYPSSNKAYLDYITNLTKQKEPFQLVRIEKGFLPLTISNDASCSGTSILSGLVGLKKGLFLTNVFVDIKNNSEKKQSIYSYFLDVMIEKFPKNIYSLYSLEQISKKAEKLKITKAEFIVSINFGLDLIKDEFLQREHAKQFVMRKNYSETNKGRLDYIYENILIQAFYLSRQNLEVFDKKIYKSLCYYLSKWIDSLYFETFPEIGEFCSLLVTHFKNKNPITLSCPNNSNFQYQQFSYETIKISRPSFQRLRKSDLSIYLQTDKPDYKKIERSLVANFIHYLDSRLNFLVINKCRMDLIPLWVNHDCFYVCPTKKSRLLEHYFNSFIELLLKDDVIKHFLDVNNIKANDSLEKFLKTSSVNREVILKEIGKGHLKMSKFILSS